MTEIKTPFTDPLRESYRDSITLKSGFIDSHREHHTALLVIDVQYLDAKRGFGVFSDEEMSGLPAESQEYYFNRLDSLVLPNIRRLQDAFRESGQEVYFRMVDRDRDGEFQDQWMLRRGYDQAVFLV